MRVLASWDKMVASKLSISKGEQRTGPRGNARVALGGNLVPRALFQTKPGKSDLGTRLIKGLSNNDGDGFKSVT